MRGKTLLIAGIIVLTLVSLVVPGCKPPSYIIAHQEEGPSFDEGRVKENPARVGIVIKQTIDMSVAMGEDMPTEGTVHDINLRTTEVLRGADAWKKIQAANPENKPAPDGYEYILAKMELKFTAVASSTRWFDHFELIIDGSKFGAFTSDTYEEYPVVENAQLPLDQQMYGSMNAGETLTGYVLVQVKTTDKTPILEYISPDVPMWYMLYQA